MDNSPNAIIDLQGTLTFVAYFILIAGLVNRLVRLSDSNSDVMDMIKPVFTSFFLVALISTVGFWFDQLTIGFNGVAETHFGNSGATRAGATEGPDFDQITNELEFLTGTNPLLASDRWNFSFTQGPGQLAAAGYPG